MGGGRRRGGRMATPKTLAMVSRAMRSARWHVGTWTKCVVFVSSAGQWLETADLPLGYLIQWQEASEHARRCSRKCDAARPWPHRRASPPASAPFSFSSKPFFPTRRGVAIPLDDQRAVFALLENGCFSALLPWPPWRSRGLSSAQGRFTDLWKNSPPSVTVRGEFLP